MDGKVLDDDGDSKEAQRRPYSISLQQTIIQYIHSANTTSWVALSLDHHWECFSDTLTHAFHHHHTDTTNTLAYHPAKLHNKGKVVFHQDPSLPTPSPSSPISACPKHAESTPSPLVSENSLKMRATTPNAPASTLSTSSPSQNFGGEPAIPFLLWMSMLSSWAFYIPSGTNQQPFGRLPVLY